MPRYELIALNGRRVVQWAPREQDLKGVFCDCPQKIPRQNIGQFTARFNFYLQTGQFPHDPEKYKPVEEGLYELKTWKYRIIGYYEDNWNTFVIVLCIFKNKQKLSSSDVKKAQDRMKLAKKDKEYIR